MLGSGHLLSGAIEREEVTAVDLGEVPGAARPGRPLELERIALELRGVGVALEGEDLNDLCGLLDLAEIEIAFVGGRKARFLLELTPCCFESVLSRLDEPIAAGVWGRRVFVL